MPRTRNINKTSLKRKGKDVFFRMSYTVDRKNGRESEAKKATLIKEVMAIIERYNLSILSVLEEHPFMKNETTPPSSPPQQQLVIDEPETPMEMLSRTSAVIDLTTPPVSDDEEEVEEDDLGPAPKKRVTISCPEELDEETDPIDAIVFNVDNLFAMQERCKLQIANLDIDMKKHEKEIKELKENYTFLRKTTNDHHLMHQVLCDGINQLEAKVFKDEVPKTSPPTPVATQEIE